MNDMLDRLFTYVLDLTVPAGIVILLVMLLRLMLKGQKKIWSYALWLVVLLRLLIPAGIALPMGDLAVPAFTSRYTLSDAEITLPEVLEGMSQGMPTVSVEGTLGGEAQTISCNWWELAVLYGKYLWLAGVIAVLLWAGLRYWRLKRKLREAVLLRDNVYVLDGITTPFVLGLVRPKIYLPSGLKEQEQEHILLHEQRHIRRDDHIFRVVAFLVLCLHWFNPLVWMAFMLSGRDMEMSCDEAVTRHMGGDERADYAQCLLRCAAGKAHIAGMPLAFSEGDTGKRIRNLANWKKPVLWLCILAVALSVPLVFIRPASAAEPVEIVLDVKNTGSPSQVQTLTMREHPDITFEISTHRYDRKGSPRFAAKLQIKGSINRWFHYVDKIILADLNGDGYRELCLEVRTFFAGNEYNKVNIYDVKNNRLYNIATGIQDHWAIEDRLKVEEDSFVIERTYHPLGLLEKRVTTCSLRLIGNMLWMVEEDGELLAPIKGKKIY